MTSIEERISHGLALIESGDISQAAAVSAALGPLPTDAPDDRTRARFFELMGTVALHEDRGADALDAFRFMLKFEERAGTTTTGLAASWNKMGSAYASNGQHEEAVEAFLRSIELFESDGAPAAFVATSRYQLAESYIALELFLKAADMLDATLRDVEDADADTRATIGFRLASALDPLVLLDHTMLSVRRMSDEFRALGMANAELDALLADYAFVSPSPLERWVGALAGAVTCLNPSFERDSSQPIPSQLRSLQAALEGAGLREIADEIKAKLQILEEEQ